MTLSLHPMQWPAKADTTDFAKWRKFAIQTKNFRDSVINQGKSNFYNFHVNGLYDAFVKYRGGFAD